MDAFLSAWSGARQTFGTGDPESGGRFDGSDRLTGLRSTLELAAPGTRWTGAAAQAYRRATTDHGDVLTELAGLDQRMRAEIDRAAAVVTAGRTDLDAVRTWVTDIAATLPRTAHGELMLYPVVRTGITRVGDIVRRSNAELGRIGDTLRGLGADYAALTAQARRDPK